jgi:hypothetical protein
LKQSFREALAEVLVRSRLPTQADAAMSMLASLQVSMAPGPRDIGLPADGGTDPTKKERNPSDEYFAAARPRSRTPTEVMQHRAVPARLAARFAEFPFY